MHRYLPFPCWVIGATLLVLGLLFQHTSGHTGSRAHAAALPRATVNPDKARNTVKNGGFETTGGWTMTNALMIANASGVLPERGHKMLNVTFGNAQQSFKVPSSAPYLRFSYQMRGATGTCGSSGRLQIALEAGTASKNENIEACSTKNTTRWVVKTYDLRKHIGKTATFSLYHMNLGGAETFLIDDVGLVSGPTRLVDYY